MRPLVRILKHMLQDKMHFKNPTKFVQMQKASSAAPGNPFTEINIDPQEIINKIRKGPQKIRRIHAIHLLQRAIPIGPLTDRYIHIISKNYLYCFYLSSSKTFNS